ncbi:MULTISPECIES: putative holin-like toxin [Bacillaceae]|nr:MULTISPECIES: putative holin-like toxin [Bacillaceae]MDX8361778.1 putative holin-like toxin [Cytobacillus sp. IB215316]
MPMLTTFEGIMLMIAFATLVVAILSFQHKK